MVENFGPEQAVHGSSWGRMHGGYFSDPEVARPLVVAVRGVWENMRPDRVVDLGGGTGYLLSQFRTAGLDMGSALVNLDGSVPQLSEAAKAGFSCVRGSVETFCRGDVVPAGQRALWTMRSVLHYAGEGGLSNLLAHLRAQAEAGECWVHQTACFERAEDAECLNALYRKMRTDKWYPTDADLRDRLASAGWQIREVRPAPTLHLDSGELGQRYGLDGELLSEIKSQMEKEFGRRSSAFRRSPAGFQANLHYGIWICSAEP